MVTVSFTETYDLSTKTGKMTLIGVHTPKKGIFQRLYPGFLMQYSKCKIISQDVRIACASMLPADPLQVGVTAGDIAPEDLFNPILYKTATNDSWSTLEARINGFSSAYEDRVNTEGYSADVSQTGATTYSDEFGIYYSLLSDRRGWKVANPQSGLSMRKIRPFVFERLYSHGVNGTTETSGKGIAYVDAEPDGDLQLVNITAQSFRGRCKPMPSFNTTCITYVANAGVNENYVLNGMEQELSTGIPDSDGQPVNAQASMPDLAKVMTAVIVIPPSRLHQLFYRMTVRTTVSFFEPRSMVEVAPFSSMRSAIAPFVHYQDYTLTSSKLLTNEESSVDVSEDATVTKIMESAD